MSRLTEEQKALMGITRPEFGGLPVTFQPAQYFEKKGQKQPQAQAQKEEKKPLTEGRKSLTMFKDIKEMVNALERARSLVTRVNATIQSGRNTSGTMMNERSRADMYRLDQEMATALESINASKDALESLDKSRRQVEREEKERKRQGR